MVVVPIPKEGEYLKINEASTPPTINTIKLIKPIITPLGKPRPGDSTTLTEEEGVEMTVGDGGGGGGVEENEVNSGVVDGVGNGGGCVTGSINCVLSIQQVYPL
jgi:hypothetical protein